MGKPKDVYEEHHTDLFPKSSIALYADLLCKNRRVNIQHSFICLVVLSTVVISALVAFTDDIQLQ